MRIKKFPKKEKTTEKQTTMKLIEDAFLCSQEVICTYNHFNELRDQYQWNGMIGRKRMH